MANLERHISVLQLASSVTVVRRSVRRRNRCRQAKDSTMALSVSLPRVIVMNYLSMAKENFAFQYKMPVISTVF